jgi:RNA polymerase sigma-70 factor (ECF subfamily)
MMKAYPAALPLPLAASEEADVSSRALEGDLSAWNALILKHNHRVVVSLLARGVRIDKAKDIAQDAWVRLIERQREGKLTHLSLPGLAVTQASFLALEEARRERRPFIDADEACLPDPAGDAETRLLTEERLSRAEEILGKCSPSARKVFRLAYSGEGLSHAEIAERVGLSLQRVRQIVCEVRKLLRSEP